MLILQVLLYYSSKYRGYLYTGVHPRANSAAPSRLLLQQHTVDLKDRAKPLSSRGFSQIKSGLAIGLSEAGACRSMFVRQPRNRASF